MISIFFLTICSEQSWVFSKLRQIQTPMPSCSHEQQHNRYLPRQGQQSYCPSLSLEGYSWYSDGPEPMVYYSHCWICIQFSAVYAHCYTVIWMVFTA